MKLVIALAASALLLTPCLSAATAEETVSAYLESLRNKEFDAAAKQFDGPSLAEFREMMSFTNDLPEEVATQFLPSFFGEGATQESVAALSDTAFFAAVLKSIFAQAEVAGGMKIENAEILGEVAEGEDVVHLVTRSKVAVGEIQLEQMEVVSVRQRGEDWKILLSGKLKGMASQLQAALGV